MGQKSTIPVAVIIVSYNTKELTRKALASLFDSSVLPSRVIVADNDSKDGSVEMIRSEFPEVELMVNQQNLGFARANNIAIRQIKDEKYIWLLNSDTEAGHKTLEQLYDYAERNRQVAGVEPQLIYPDRSWQSVGGFFPSIRNVKLYLLPISYFFTVEKKKKIKSLALYPQEIPATGLELDYITGAAAFFRKSVLDQVGLLGEEYFMYFEETDLCWRIKKAGYKLMAIKTDPVMHVYGGSYKSRYDKKRLKIFLDSLEIFVKKNYTGFKKYLILLEIVLVGRLSLFIKSFKK